MVYQLIDGTLVGFYRESGTELIVQYYQDVYETRIVNKSERTMHLTLPDLRLERYYVSGHWGLREFTILEHTEYQYVKIEGQWKYTTWTEPAHWGTREYWLEPYTEIHYREVEGYWETTDEYIQGHSEIQEVWIPEYSETRYREVAAHTEVQNIWVDGYYVTRYYWREAHPARGLEAAWIPYQLFIPGGYKDTRVWVPAATEEYQVIVPGYFEDQRVWVEGRYEEVPVWHKSYFEPYEVEIPGVWQERRIWFPDVTRTTKAWIPVHEELRLVTVPETTEVRNVWIPIEEKFRTVDYGSKEVWTTRYWQETEEVFIGRLPVYSQVDPETALMFTVESLVRAPADDPDAEDHVVIRNVLTGEVLTTSARFMGQANRLGINEYVVP